MPNIQKIPINMKIAIYKPYLYCRVNQISFDDQLKVSNPHQI